MGSLVPWVHLVHVQPHDLVSHTFTLLDQSPPSPHPPLKQNPPSPSPPFRTPPAPPAADAPPAAAPPPSAAASSPAGLPPLHGCLGSFPPFLLFRECHQWPVSLSPKLWQCLGQQRAGPCQPLTLSLSPPQTEALHAAPLDAALCWCCL
eukprot:CAMPEP_0181315644 /NCGR_PEP_ID=MMETSP1101-20121128/15485_1 /TAXON_ID=46948 /ORGANISM="Rhodomonas abbreviata, Strain Caron Lab Isolate" /LENGTH=148 /DNA_ID=CAMNT_0023422865 /DNA_START=170 /DNA_END=616 /DNA_ORIENTATION=-